MKVHYRKSRFTLIELLLVIAIIAILASLIIPTISKARAKAKQAYCLSSTKQLNTALTLFVYDDDEKRLSPSYNYVYENGSWTFKLWEYKLKEYIATPKAIDCPSDTREITGFGWSNYGYNDWLNDSGYAHHWAKGKKLAKIPAPANTIAYGDGLYRMVHTSNWQSWFHLSGRHEGKTNYSLLDGSAASMDKTKLNQHPLYQWYMDR